MNTLQEPANRRVSFSVARSRYRNNENSYLWERDFPVNLQTRKAVNQSIFRLEFELNEEEIYEFKDKIKSDLNGTLL